MGGSGGGGFKFKSKHSTSKRSLPQFGKSPTHPPRTPQRQYAMSTQTFEPSYRDLLYRNTPTPSFGTRFDPFAKAGGAAPVEVAFKTRHKRKPHFYSKYSKRF